MASMRNPAALFNLNPRRDHVVPDLVMPEKPIRKYMLPAAVFLRQGCFTKQAKLLRPEAAFSFETSFMAMLA
jgi:hypothetical protein